MDVEAYIKRLYLAFDQAPRPRPEEITPHRCGECDEVAARLALRAHAEVPDGDMDWLGDSLPLLSPMAFRYFLPAFVAFCLRHPQSSVDALINYNLAPTGSLDDGERNRFRWFSVVERQAIAEFVEFRYQQGGADLDRPYLERAREFWNASPVPPFDDASGENH